MAMVSSRITIFLLPYLIIFVLIIIIITQANIDPNQPLVRCDNEKGNYTTSSTYEANLNRLLSTLFSNTSIDRYGAFYNSSYGQNPDKVYGIGLCRGDIDPESCRNCLNNSANSMRLKCPNQKEAILWYNECMLRYSNRSIFGVMESFPSAIVRTTQTITSDLEEAFNKELLNLFGKLRSEAAGGDSQLKYAAGNVVYGPNSQMIYALLQCTPDLSSLECMDCVGDGSGGLPLGLLGGQAVHPSCRTRYQTNQFYNTSTPPPASPPQGIYKSPSICLMILYSYI